MSAGLRGALAAAVALLLGLAPPSARAADTATIEIAGAVATPLHLSAAEIEALPPTDIDVTFHTGHGDEKGRFTGVTLWSLVQKAGLADHQGNRPDLRHAIAIVGGDGYTVVVSFGEIDPDFENKSVILAWARDGKPLDDTGGLRLIVPGDAHGGRDVRDVVKIEVR